MIRSQGNIRGFIRSAGTILINKTPASTSTVTIASTQAFCSTKDITNAQNYITDNIKQKQWTSFVIGKFLPKPLRPAYHSIMWFNHELSKIPESSRQPSLAAGKIEFWRSVITRIYTPPQQQQQPSQQQQSSQQQQASQQQQPSSPPANPFSEPLSLCLYDACHSHPLTKLYFTRLLEARLYELYNPQLATMEQMMRLTEKIRGSTVMLTLELLRLPITPQVEQLAMQAGRAIGICDYIKRLPVNMRSYRLYMPAEVLAKHNASVRTLWDRTHGKPKEELFDVILEVAAYARECLNRVKERQQVLPPEAFRAFLPLVETELYLQRLQKNNFNVFSQSMNQQPALTLPPRLFKAARNKSFTYH